MQEGGKNKSSPLVPAYFQSGNKKNAEEKKEPKPDKMVMDDYHDYQNDDIFTRWITSTISILKSDRLEQISIRLAW